MTLSNTDRADFRRYFYSSFYGFISDNLLRKADSGQGKSANSEGIESEKRSANISKILCMKYIRVSIAICKKSEELEQRI